MTTYRMRKMSETTFDITSGGAKVGFVKRLCDGPNTGKFAGRIGKNGHLVILELAREVLAELAAIKTRINFCGENDREKALTALRAHNAKIDAFAAEHGRRVRRTGINI